MMKFKLTIVLLILTVSLMAQEKRFISSEQAVEKAPRLIGMNFQVIGENNEKGIDSTEVRQIEYLFITDEKEKADSLIEKIKTSYEYKVYIQNPHQSSNPISPKARIKSLASF